jgi:lipopolysaccharide assembly outer membrane protein LptD (OstA)
MKFLLILIFLSVNFQIILAQEADSTLFKRIDTLSTFAKDSLSLPDSSVKKKTYDVDTVIYASSTDSLFFYVNQKKMDLYGKSELKYKDTDLKSANIFINFNTNNVDAYGVPNDSLPNKFSGTPTLSQNGEVYDGQSMKYNFKTTRGFITQANTGSEGARYTGEKINKVGRDTYFVKDGTYTTCDTVPPDYYFYSPEMKVIQKKEIIAKWIWIFFGGVPFPIPLPFAVFPLQSGRRSGIIAPAFGQDGTYGYYFSHFGYFWAINDYVDLNLTGDYYTRGSFGFNTRFRYVKRYDYNGSIQGGYRLFKSTSYTGSSTNKQWSIALSHHQTFTPTLRLDANLQFLSGKNYIQSTTYNMNEALQNNIYSNATLYKSWDESGNSMTISYTRNQDLESGDISEILPSFSFNIPFSYPFKRKGVFNKKEWYEYIGYSYSGQFQNHRNKSGGHLSVRGGINHSINVSASPKVGYFNISPNVSYNEEWYNKQVEMYSAGINADSTGDSVITKDIHKISEVRTFRLGLSASTKFYGMFQPNILGISAIRHIVTPSISYNFTPDFSKAGWGYYGTYINYLGQQVKYDKYKREIFSAPTSGEQQSISFSLGNVFEMKTAVDPTDTTSKAKKIQLLNLSANISYNFAKDSLRFSDLGLSYHTQVGEFLNFSGSSSFSLYDYSSKGYDINKFLINEGKGLLRLRNFNFSISTSLSGEKLKSKEKEKPKQEQPVSDAVQPPESDIYQGIYNNKQPDFSIPWNLSLSYNYSFTKNSPYPPSSNISASLDFNLTPKWKFAVAGSYDFRANQFSAPQIRISRDLHCWIMNFTWNPIGTFSGYYLEIRVKAPELQDLKITKRGQFYNGK